MRRGERITSILGAVLVVLTESRALPFTASLASEAVGG